MSGILPCSKNMSEYCTGFDLQFNDLSWLQRWEGSDSCFQKILSCSFKSPPKNILNICNQKLPPDVDPDGFFWSQKLINSALIKYKLQGFQIGSSPNQETYNPFQDLLFENICCPYPGLCQTMLHQQCKDFNLDQVSKNQILSQWCGCHLPTKVYEKYSVQYSISPQCSPLCNRSDTIHLTGVNSNPVTCESSICIIDDTTLNIINSQIGGNVSFNQFCGSCNKGECSCIFSDNEIDIINSTVNKNFIPIVQNCGSFSCNINNPYDNGPDIVSVPCGELENGEKESYLEVYRTQQQKNNRATAFWILGLLFLLIFLFLFLWFIFKNKNTMKILKT